MAHEVQMGVRKRMSFSRIGEALDMPNLIEVQRDSYRRFVEEELKDVLEDVSPITDQTGKLVLEFVDYSIDFEHPKFSVAESKDRDANYSAPLRMLVRLTNKETGEIKQQEVFFGDFPLMTEQGTFIINGAERVIVSQLVRSPGAYYFEARDPKSSDMLYSSQIIPNRGAWLEYETDSNKVLYVKIDRGRKMNIITLIRALGYATDDEIRELFGDDSRLSETLRRYAESFAKESAGSAKDPVEYALKAIYEKMRPGETPTVEAAKNYLNGLLFDRRRYDLARVGRYKLNKKFSIATRITGRKSANMIINTQTGEIIVEEGMIISADDAKMIENIGINSVDVIDDSGLIVRIVGNNFVDAKDYLPFEPIEAGINEKVHYPTLMSILEETQDMDEESLKQYIKERIGGLIPHHIIKDDIVASVSYIIGMAHGIGNKDDIDHLGNRRIRSVGELLQNQIRVGLTRLEKIVHDRMNTAQDPDSLTPSQLTNTRPVASAIKEFFGSSQLSQFMDQTNPLAELTHKRRLSALGPGGLNRDRATFEVRDVHYSHYGRMCPIETPEGPNIGLINSLSTYARINEYGFIEAPYRKVDAKNHRILGTEGIVYLAADEEDGKIIAQANEPVVTDENGNTWFAKDRIVVRQRDQILEVSADQVDYMDVSPKQLVSVATAMIPFLENDDANRALMGSNMQRQAVPLLMPEAPYVGTGMEYKAAYDSGVVVVSKHDGKAVHVGSSKIVIQDAEGEKHTYNLIKFKRSNQGTCINQRPLVFEGDMIKKGQVIADGASTEKGEIALGRNILIGFMTWEGYNYEDAVLISEKLVREDAYTSIHIEKLECEARDTKLGTEEITRDIPNVGEDALRYLDANGIIIPGAEVKPGDILVGKVTPKGETELTPEEKLLRAIFGEKSREVRDTSLRVPHGEGGVIVDVKIFSRENKDEVPAGVEKLVRVYIAQKRKISVGDKMAGRHGNKGVISRVLPEEDMPFLDDGTPLQIVLNPLGVPSRMNIGQILELHLGLAAKKMDEQDPDHDWHIATPVFDGATEEDLKSMLRAVGCSEDGKSWLRDGRSGEYFENKVSVGYMYYLKLHHLVDDKIHARSTGPYSLVTQQPLGGKAQFGGQRFGEMEVWALEAYGAANTLQEILTVKSDDIVGRVKTYEAIVKGENIPEPGIPESFKVLVKELQSLGLDIKVLNREREVMNLDEFIDNDITTTKSVSNDDDDIIDFDDDDDFSLLSSDDDDEEDLDMSELDDDEEDMDDIYEGLSDELESLGGRGVYTDETDSSISIIDSENIDK